MIGNSNHISGVGFIRECTVLGEKELRRTQGDDLACAYLFDFHSACELTGAKAYESDTVTMIGIQVRLYLENECRHAELGSSHDPHVGVPCSRWRGHFCECFEQVTDAKILEGTTEENRGHVALAKSPGIKPLAGVAHQIELSSECCGIKLRTESDDFGERHSVQFAGGTWLL